MPEHDSEDAGGPKSGGGVSVAAGVLEEALDEVLATWTERVRAALDEADALSTPVLTDTFPVLLEQLVEALSMGHTRLLAGERSSIASEHGGERARMTDYSATHVIAEMRLLRDVILDTLEAHDALDPRAERIVRRSFEESIHQSMMAFYVVHMQLREQTVATLTHDLRGPLSTISTSSQLIERLLDGELDTSTRERVRELARGIYASLCSADALIVDLLDRLRASFERRARLNVSACQLRSIIDEVIAPGDVTRVVIEGQDVEGWWDADLLRRALRNLISNAIKHGDSSSPVGVRVSTHQGRVLVAVHNEGDAIPIEQQGRIFGAYQRSAGEEVDGFGLGLHQVRRAAEAHGGSIVVESTDELGTTFTLDVPIDARPESLERPDRDAHDVHG